MKNDTQALPPQLDADKIKALEANAILDYLRCDFNGLSTAQARARLEFYGPNAIREKHQNPWLKFLSYFWGPIAWMIETAAILSAVVHNYEDLTIILFMLIFNAIVGFWQEYQAGNAIEQLKKNLALKARVFRNGEWQTVDASELVPGDKVKIRLGDIMPADIVLLEGDYLTVDQSALTGESLPVDRHVGDLLYASSVAKQGEITGVVTTTGAHTFFGRTARLVDTAQNVSHFKRAVIQIGDYLIFISLALVIILVLVGLERHLPLMELLQFALILTVAAIPVALPAVLSVTMAIGAIRLAKLKAIVSRLEAIEELAGMDILCSDKTGTLTQNQMTVKTIYAGGVHFGVGGSGYTPEGELQISGKTIEPSAYPVLLEILKAGLLCNDARLIADAHEWRIEGDPTEAALVVAAHKAGLHHSHISRNHPRLDAIPFESQHQYMATLHHNLALDQRHIYLKGSLESLLSRCDKAFDARMNPIRLDPETLRSQQEQLAAQGLRVLAFARCDHCTDEVEHREVAGGLTFLGLQAMIDPPRPEAVAAISACYRAGIQVKMITGDHPVTALAIARQLGMRNSDRVVGGAELEKLSEDQYTQQVQDCDIYARIAPEQKLQLVQALQAAGHVVAMTGDGVNDAPALRQADIGVAMGLSGTEVAKEAADMILTNDDFATIEAAVEEGRGVFDNMVKFIAWTLPTNLGEGLVIVAAVMADVALPITPVQILWINMTTAVLLGLMLAFEPKEPGLMDRQPRAPEQAILTKHLVFRICLVGVLLLASSFGLFEWELMHGESLAKARTVAVNVFVCGELFYLFNCRSLHYSMFKVGLFTNLWAIFGVVTMILLQTLFTYWPPMQGLFGSASIGKHEWQLIFGAGFIVYLTIGLEKLLLRQLD